MYAEHPHLAAIDEVAENDEALSQPDRRAGRCGVARWTPSPSTPPSQDFYLTNAILRASKIMADCSALALAERGDVGRSRRVAECR